jgi:spore maturation protein CgeB
MRFLILNTDYTEFLQWLYDKHPGLEGQPYEEQMRVRNESLFGLADFYSDNLRKLGNEAWDIHVNNEFMQRAWAQQYNIPTDEAVSIAQPGWSILQQIRCVVAQTPLRYLKPLFRPVLRSLDKRQYKTLAAQIKYYRPDVLFNLDMKSISSSFLKEMKPYVRLLVGQIASPLPPNQDFRCYDLILSSLPNFVEDFRRTGVPAELHRFAFEPKILERLKQGESKISISFVGSLSSHHKARVQLLEQVCAHQDMEVWGQGIQSLPGTSSIRRCYQGEAWGLEMYQILSNSKITLNHHINVAGPYANNMRLFEATGVRTLLITDWKVNLHEMFEPGKEVVSYRTPEECTELIQYYLEHDEERKSIASAGQKRVLQEHTYYHRMQEFLEMVGKYF